VPQRGGKTFHFSPVNNVASSPARGVVTEVVTVPGDTTRQIVLNRYD